ncbi:hypothetical protein PA25_29600 [Pseudoalteromonas sp. A25]|uniref:PilW family protein n=1 Tax=Pseudoalteromonas sp. A25 TaxID=116092 RepID=UPI001261023D|nr:prepilin-type N-terminal cleavage/methylation domain-containing protein [Pseudoalteromonas sp. A25]BBN82975.1 hypothetical protein PA25_29600 [Pseudoalteromonas sp. A25]
MQRGFSLIELMVALTVGSFLLAGIAMSYSAIKNTVLTTRQLANAQEVIRYTNQILSRSIKQTYESPVITGNGVSLEVKQNANSPSCQGSVPTIEYKEVYTLSNNYLTCDILNNVTGESLGALNLLRGVEALQFSSSRSGRLIDVTVTPVNVPTQFANGIVISLAATRVIMR